MQVMKKFKLMAAFVAFFGWVSAAQALLYLEPYAGYRLSSFDITAAGQTYEFSQSGIGYGARVGTSLIPFITVGLQYEMGTYGLDLDTSGVTSNLSTEEYDSTHMGIFAAFTSLPLVNVWGTYFLSSNLEVSKAGSNAVGDTIKGSGYGLGAGFTGLPFLSINVDYRMFSYDKFESAAGVESSLAAGSERDVTEIMLSISSPWDL